VHHVIHTHTHFFAPHGSKCLLNIFISFNEELSSIIKKGKIKSASRPLVDFGVLNDNLIKGLTLCVKCISRF
jgi:hypothetical protein